jgi:hypothetical protein
MDAMLQEIETLKVPDAFTPVVGFKRFGIPWPRGKGNNCLLVQKGHCWTPKAPTAAECRRPGSSGACGNPVPAQSCGCGLYAWLDVEEALHYYELSTMMGWVLASVIGWGRVLFDEDFWRAEQAQLVAFADPKDTHSDKPEIVQERTGAWLERVADNYEVPILPLEQLREYTLSYGEEYLENG